MRRTIPAVLLSLMVLLPMSAANNQEDPLYGFTAVGSAAERDWESKFRAIPSPAIMRDSMQRLSARPHHVGSSYDVGASEYYRLEAEYWLAQARIGH